MQIYFTRAAGKHGISQSRIRYVIEHCGLVGREAAPHGSAVGSTYRLIYLGDDAAGVALEVMAVELASGALLVIHAMPLRAKYRWQYEEAKKWRR